jgi:tetratricopeptide (TPR) repeat protein
MAFARKLPWRFFRHQLLLWFTVAMAAFASHQSTSEIVRAGILLFVLAPLALVVHELGHLITARLCGVEVGGFGIGQGRKLWAGEIWGVPVRILSWPLSGRVYLGGFKLPGLRARIALTTLMGPGANALMVWATVHFWEAAARTCGVVALIAWSYVNVLMAFSNLVPFQFSEGGVPYRSDGLALWRILRNQFKASDYAVSAPLMRVVACLDRRDYARAIPICEAALERDPDNLGVLLLLALCHHNSHDSPRALQLIEPLLLRSDLNALLRAYVQQLKVLALLVVFATRPPDDLQSGELDRLAAETFECVPCDLSIRSARALVLLSRGRPHEALALLEYVHYDRGTPAESGGRAAVRFCAYRQLGQEGEAARMLTIARKVHPDSLDWLVRMGLVSREEIALPSSTAGVHS